MRMIDRLFGVILVLNATGLFAFVAVQCGVTIGAVSIALLALNALYLIARVQGCRRVLRRGGVGAWLVVLVLWPLASVLYAPSLEVRAIGLQVYCFTLFFGTVVYTVTNGLGAMYWVMAVSVCVSIVGIALGMAAPGYFEAVSDLADANVLKEGRACGFLLQPNQMAVSLGMLFVGWFSLWRRKGGVLEVVTILVLMLAMLLTGSRTGILVAVIAVVFIEVPERENGKWVVGGRYLKKAAMLGVCLAIGVVCARVYLADVKYADGRTEDLFDRMETMLSFRLSEQGVRNDSSVQARIAAQAVFWSLFRERPLVGHGLGADVYYMERGLIDLAAHSDALTFAVRYGAVYPVALCSLICLLRVKKSCRDVERIMKTRSVTQFVVISVLLIGFSSVRDTRTFYVVMAMFFAAVYCTADLFVYDRQTGRMCGLLEGGDVRGCRGGSMEGWK